MESFLNSFVLVFLSEMGDKTQLLALVLAARYRKPFVVMAGILVATLLNHFLAAWLGSWSTHFLDSEALRWVLGFLFLGFAAWILIPDKESDLRSFFRWGPFVTTLVSFFIAEMGDKTQLATIALGARYKEIFWVTLGTTAGMLGSNAIAVFLGDRLLKRIPMKWVRLSASLIFALFGLALLWGVVIKKTG